VIADKDELALVKAIQHRCANLVMKHIQDRHACHVIRAFVGVDRNLLWPDATISFAEFSGGEWVPVTRFE
jgi:hypothetical protein